MNEENFSPQQSLQVIQSMISKTRQNFHDNSKYFLLWGWLATIAISGQFVLKVIFHYEKFFQVWFILFIGIALSNYWMIKDGKKEKVKTYVGESMSNLWLGMAISFFVLSMLFVKMGWYYCYPFFIMMYGLGTFVSGKILQFTPFVIGGILAWVLSIVSAWFDFDYQMLFAVAALLISYIIPAHLLRLHQQNQKSAYGR
ncbi:MAG: hypothetical protein EKK37_09980 [Sphingobacteriales bacterium]|nr:MAG: hypothetical protein EKK37_09980 [Sphingobacteriales bacterium]